MTGGIGFSRDGKNTLKRNRDILNPRKRNAQNPYWGKQKISKNLASNFSELINWKRHRVSIIKKRSVFIFIGLGFIALLIK